MTDLKVMEDYRWALKELSLLRKQEEHLLKLLGPAGLPEQTGFDARRKTSHFAAMLQQQLKEVQENIAMREAAAAGLIAAFHRVLNGVHDARTRAVLSAYYGMGWTISRTAEMLHLSEATVSRVLHRWARPFREEACA